MDKKRKFVLYLAELFLIGFLFVLVDVLRKGFLYNFDLTVNSFIPSIHNRVFTAISVFIAYLFDPIIVVLFFVLLAGYYFFKHEKKEFWFVLLVGIFTGGLLLLLKDLIQRARPSNMLMQETSYAFPSGHAAIAVVLFGVLFYLFFQHFKSRFIRVLSLAGSGILVLIIGFSRVYLNVHWFSDVLAGFFLGLFLLSLAVFFFKGFYKVK